uniref:Uncharacterized protein n=1 Tax=Rhodnius prolixus TaxID=13249 RepID=T1HPQ6_RHOPR
MRTACCSLVLIATYYFPFCNANRHRISKRFVYPSGSVIQFAMGLALPAAVIGRNIATNSGILVNYALPTNVTELKVPFSSTTRIAQEKILNEIIFMLKNNNFDEECLYKSLCLLGENKHYSASLWYQLFQTLIIFSADDSRVLVYPNGGVFKFILGWGIPVHVPMSVVFAHNIQFQYNPIDNYTEVSELIQNGVTRTLNVTKYHFYSMLENILLSPEQSVDEYGSAWNLGQTRRCHKIFCPAVSELLGRVTRIHFI